MRMAYGRMLSDGLDGEHGLPRGRLAELSRRFGAVQAEVRERRAAGEYGFYDLVDQEAVVREIAGFAEGLGQAHDHVLKEEERRRNAFVRVCNYILENPLRAELVRHPAEWPLSGAVVPGYPTLHPFQENFWSKFWKLYAQAKHPGVWKILRPPIR